MRNASFPKPMSQHLKFDSGKTPSTYMRQISNNLGLPNAHIPTFGSTAEETGFPCLHLDPLYSTFRVRQFSGLPELTSTRTTDLGRQLGPVKRPEATATRYGEALHGSGVLGRVLVNRRRQPDGWMDGWAAGTQPDTCYVHCMTEGRS